MYCVNGFVQCSTVMPSMWNNFWYDTTGRKIKITVLANYLATTVA